MAIPVIPRRRVVLGTEDESHFRKFVVPPREPLATPDLRRADVVLRRTLANSFDLKLPFTRNGRDKLEMWAIGDDRGPAFPGPLVRVRKGQTVQIRTGAKKAQHTIHWHGIEPTPLNDGVGKHSFEIEGEYVYQWQADLPGFYFYHCHRNTVLHFEMGLYGALIVDPVQGPGWVQYHDPANGHVTRYDRELIWVCGAHDSRWHGLNKDEGMMHSPSPNDPLAFDKDGILNDWRPDVFTISGAVAKNATTPITDSRVAGTARVGQTVLIRLLNSSYATQRYRFGMDIELIARDGRAYGVPPYGVYSRPVRVPAGQTFELMTAQRHDILFRPTAKGTYPFVVDYIDWRGYGTRGTARTTITVS